MRTCAIEFLSWFLTIIHFCYILWETNSSRELEEQHWEWGVAYSSIALGNMLSLSNGCACTKTSMRECEILFCYGSWLNISFLSYFEGDKSI